MVNKKRTWKDIESSIILSLFLIAFIGWLIWSIYQAFWMPPQPEKTIKFEITGIVNGTEANTLAQVHYECIKYCISHTSVNMDKCYEQCALLGKEGCQK